MDHPEIPVGELKARLSDLVSQSAYQGKRFIITRHNKPVAALVSIEDLKEMEKALAAIQEEGAR